MLNFLLLYDTIKNINNSFNFGEIKMMTRNWQSQTKTNPIKYSKVEL